MRNLILRVTYNLSDRILFLVFGIIFGFIYLLIEAMSAVIRVEMLGRAALPVLLILMALSFFVLIKRGRYEFLKFGMNLFKAAGLFIALVSIRHYLLSGFGRINLFELGLCFCFSLTGHDVIESVICVLRAWASTLGMLLNLQSRRQFSQRHRSAESD